MPRPVVGARVVVPLGGRIVTGIVMDDVSASTVEDSAVKAVKDVLDTDAFVPLEVVELARWTAEYYAAGPGDTITAVLPPMARGGRSDAHKTIRVAAITAAGLDAVHDPERVALRTTQLDALQLLAGTPMGISTPELAARGIAADAVTRLARKGFI